jgi:glycosyltransferase involved in cell wall biosynthesis
LRLVHVVDREDGRGGAHAHLQGLVAVQRRSHEVHVVSGGGLESREAAPVDLARIDALRPALVHVHTVVNPRALDALAGAGAVITVQDHRYFCPGRGKWTRDGAVCHEPASPALCVACFEDETYGAEVQHLTAARLAAVRRFGAVIVLSRYMRDELVRAGVDSERVHVIPPIVEPVPAHEPDGPPCVLFAGRLVEHKGVRDAVHAWKRSGIALPLVMAGTGPLRAWAEAEGATVLGWVERERLGAVYARAAALVMPSRWQEPFGIAGLEALRAGVPVVAWRSGGIAEWHPGGDLLVEWGDVDGLARALKAAIGRPAEPVVGPGDEEIVRRVDEVYRALEQSDLVCRGPVAYR